MDLTPNNASVSLQVSDIIRETHNTKSFVLSSPENHPIVYKAGQFLTFLFKIGRHELRRSYSIASSPALNEPLMITVKRIDNGEISRFLHDKLLTGDRIETIGANGFFTMPAGDLPHRRFIFFAAGSGIVPVYSLIKTILHKHEQHSILLVYSNLSMRSTIFYRELGQLQQQFRRKLTIDFLFSNAKQLRHARLTPESMDLITKEHRISNQGTDLFYTCGPPGYMRMVAFKLALLGVSISDIKREIFKIEKPAAQPLPPDTDAHQITVLNRLTGQRQRFLVQYPQTILAAAKKLHIPLPFSCETGQCGTCAVTCISGKVWMSNNEVLLDEELAKGRVLTCTGFPLNGDVIIEMLA